MGTDEPTTVSAIKLFLPLSFLIIEKKKTKHHQTSCT